MRKIYYNMVITGLSVAVALLIGTVELMGILVEKMHLSGGVWDWIAAIDLGWLGFVIVALFAVTWLVALAAWRFGRIEEKWSTRLREVPETTD